MPSPETILSVLSRPNPEPSLQAIGPGPNTKGRTWLGFDGWEPWTEFTAKNLRRIYKATVKTSWDGSFAEPKLSTLDRAFGNEDGFEHQILSRSTIPAVNAALAQARYSLNQSAKLHLGRRGRCAYQTGSKLHPDWVLVSNSDYSTQLTGKRYTSLLAGDTKLSKRWVSDGAKTAQWQLPVSQVLTYANHIGSRYGFLVTDKELVVFQFRREEVGPGPPSWPRAPAASEASSLSETFRALSVSPSHTHSDYSGTSSGFDFQKPRFCAIPWTNHGKDQLTVKLALFYLCLMAGYGSRHIATWYPQLDTWWRLDTGHMRHNTSGATKRQQETGDKLQEPRAGVAAQGTAAGVDEQDYEQDYGGGGL